MTVAIANVGFALPSIKRENWVEAVQEADALLVWGGSPRYLTYWMRESGLADLLPTLGPEMVYVGTSGGAMVATPDFGGARYDDFQPLTGSDDALALVDFSVFPHFENEAWPEVTLEVIERWASGLSVPAYAIDDQTAIKVVDISSRHALQWPSPPTARSGRDRFTGDT